MWLLARHTSAHAERHRTVSPCVMHFSSFLARRQKSERIYYGKDTRPKNKHDTGWADFNQYNFTVLRGTAQSIDERGRVPAIGEPAAYMGCAALLPCARHKYCVCPTGGYQGQWRAGKGGGLAAVVREATARWGRRPQHGFLCMPPCRSAKNTL